MPAPSRACVLACGLMAVASLVGAPAAARLGSALARDALTWPTLLVAPLAAGQPSSGPGFLALLLYFAEYVLLWQLARAALRRLRPRRPSA